MSSTHLHPNVVVITPPKIIPAAKPEPEARFLSLPSRKAATRIDSPVAEHSTAKSLKHSCNDQNNFRWRNASCQRSEIPQGPGNATNFLQYENSTYGIKMQYPSDWQSVGGASNFSIVASFNPQRNYASYFAVQIENLSTGYTPDQYLNSLMLGDAATTRIFQI